MEKWVSCPECGKGKIKFMKVQGNVRIVGGVLETKCRACKNDIEIYDDCKVRVVNA